MSREISENVKAMILNEIEKIFQSVDVLLFGSFAQNKARLNSDIDICLKGNHGPLDFSQLAQLKVNLEESNIPFKVDVVDFYRMNEGFKSIALKDVVLWKKAN